MINSIYTTSTLLSSRKQNVILQLQLCFLITLPLFEFDDQRILDRKHRIIVQVF